AVAAPIPRLPPVTTTVPDSCAPSRPCSLKCKPPAQYLITQPNRPSCQIGMRPNGCGIADWARRGRSHCGNLSQKLEIPQLKLFSPQRHREKHLAFLCDFCGESDRRGCLNYYESRFHRG